MEGNAFRSFKMMPHSSYAENRRAYSASECRRSSKDGIQKMSRDGNSRSFFSMSASSFANTLQRMPSWYGETTHDISSSTINKHEPNNNNGNPFGDSSASSLQESSPWSAKDRAERVDSNPELKRLLAEEIKKSGIVTAAGYKAVHRQFLYSEAVEQELKLANSKRSGGWAPRAPRRESGRFSLITAASLRLSCSKDFVVSKRLSSDGGGGGGSSRRGSADTMNLAPVKSSMVRILTPEEREELLRETAAYRESTRNSLTMKSALDNIDQSHNDDAAREDDLRRCDSSRSLGLQDVFDGCEGSNFFPPKNNSRASPSSEGVSICMRRLAETNHFPLKATPTCTTDLLKMNIRPVQFDDEVGDDSDSSDDTTATNSAEKEGDEALKSSFVDECGWLPWPERRDHEDDDDNVGNRGEELLEPFPFRRLPCEGDELPRPSIRKNSTDDSSEDLAKSVQPIQQDEGSFMPWPEVLKDDHARAA